MIEIRILKTMDQRIKKSMMQTKRMEKKEVRI